MTKVAVLSSGGLDSCVLLADQARDNDVFPLYVRFGLAWEQAEQVTLRGFIAALAHPRVAPLTTLEVPVAPIYGKHWSMTGEDVPAYEAPDEAVYLPGRNVLLIGLAATWCAVHEVEKIAIGSLDLNPFPDATPQFFAEYARLLSGALSSPIEVIAPYRGLHKDDLIRAHTDLPLERTLTCMSPSLIDFDSVLHCGDCNKCRERQEAFAAAGVADPTRYAVPGPGIR